MNHAVFQEIQALSHLLSTDTQESLRSLPFTHVHVRRAYSDGSLVWLSNTPRFIENYVSFNIPMPRAVYFHPQDPPNNRSGAYLWQEALPVINRSFFREGNNLAEGITLYRYDATYSEAMAFGIKAHTFNQFPFTFYAQALPELWRFKEAWFARYDGLLNRLHQKQKTFRIPTHKEDTLEEIMKKIPQKGFFFETPLKRSLLLSQDEWVWLYLIKEGKNLYELEKLTSISIPNLNKALFALSEKLDLPFYQVPLHFPSCCPGSMRNPLERRIKGST